MPRRTVTINKTIESKLREIQASLIKATHKDCSFTTVVNLLILGGLIGSDNFDKQVWLTLRRYAENKMIDLSEDIPCDFVRNLHPID